MLLYNNNHNFTEATFCPDAASLCCIISCANHNSNTYTKDPTYNITYEEPTMLTLSITASFVAESVTVNT